MQRRTKLTRKRNPQMYKTKTRTQKKMKTRIRVVKRMKKKNLKVYKTMTTTRKTMKTRIQVVKRMRPKQVEVVSTNLIIQSQKEVKGPEGPSPKNPKKHYPSKFFVHFFYKLSRILLRNFKTSFSKHRFQIKHLQHP